MLLNGVGAALSAVVFVIAAVTKFSHGAWLALLLIALLAVLAWRVRWHYDSVRRALALHPLDPCVPLDRVPPAHDRDARGERSRAMLRAESDESPEQIQHLAVVPIVRLDLFQPARAGVRCLAQPARLAVHISPDHNEAARFKSYWAAWSGHLPLEVVDSPYRALVTPLACYIDALRSQRSELTLTVVLPELIVKHGGSSFCTTAPPADCGASCDTSRELSSPRSHYTCRPDCRPSCRTAVPRQRWLGQGGCGKNSGSVRCV
jgi:hypothetical protein